MIMGGWLLQQLNFETHPALDPNLRLEILLMVAIFMAASAIPFVPGAEIGIGLMVMFGGRVIIVVYVCMVAAFLLAFVAGRFVPATFIAKTLNCLGSGRAEEMFIRLCHTDIDQRIDKLINKLPGNMVPVLSDHRYLAAMLLLNMPGNSLLGGGGGIAFICGMSGIFSFAYFALAVAIAVAPVPLLFFLAL